MPWFKIDDSLAFNAKFIALPLDAAGLWLRCGAWCAQQLSDGHIPAHVVRSMGGSKRHTDALERAGLWEDTADGWRFHDWGDYQPTRESVRAERAASAQRVKEWREKRKGVKKAAGQEPAGQDATNDAGNDVRADDVTPYEQSTNDVRTPLVTEPVKRCPDPSPSLSLAQSPSLAPSPSPSQSQSQPSIEEEMPATRTRRRAPATPIPDDWQPTDEHRKQAADKGLDLADEAQRFRYHAHAHDRRMVRWNAGFSGWLANSASWARPGNGSTKPAATSTTDARVAAVQALKGELRPTDQRSIGA